MRRFVHTPKNAVKEKMDTKPLTDALEKKGFLLFGTKERKTTKLFKKVEERMAIDKLMSDTMFLKRAATNRFKRQMTKTILLIKDCVTRTPRHI